MKALMSKAHQESEKILASKQEAGIVDSSGSWYFLTSKEQTIR